MKKIIAIIIILIVSLLIVGMTANSLFAAEDKVNNFFDTSYEPLSPLPGLEQAAGVDTDLEIYLQGVVRFLIALAGGLAVVYITIGGVEYMLSDSVTSKETAKNRIQASILGLILAIISWLILYTINPTLLELKIFG